MKRLKNSIMFHLKHRKDCRKMSTRRHLHYKFHNKIVVHSRSRSHRPLLSSWSLAPLKPHKDWCTEEDSKRNSERATLYLRLKEALARKGGKACLNFPIFFSLPIWLLFLLTVMKSIMNLNCLGRVHNLILNHSLELY